MTRHLTDETIEELLGAPDGADDEVLEHLDGCSECRLELHLARTVDEALAAVPRMVAPESLLEGVMTAVAATRARRRRIAAVATTFALAGVAAVLAWLVSGGAAAVVLEAIELTRVASVMANVADALWSAFQLPVAAASVAVLLLAAAALQRVVARAAVEHEVGAEAG